MTYPFVQAAFDYGTRKGPILGFVVHMAEGGGTVAYLAGDPARGVSVHYVIEYSGRTVQMLLESHASGSINPADIRLTDDPDHLYGRTAALAVLGSTWANDPNSAVISLEIEGFAANGPNPDQDRALVALVDDVRTRHPSIDLLGHRDFADYKACPGHLIPWAALGGHGPANGGNDMRFVKAIDGKLLPVAAGDPWLYVDGSAGGAFSKATEVRVIGTIDAHTGQYLARIVTGAPYADGVARPTDVLVLSTRALVDAPVAAPPVADCTNAVAAEHERVRAAAIAAAEAL